jgi:hypothetical protein
MEKSRISTKEGIMGVIVFNKMLGEIMTEVVISSDYDIMLFKSSTGKTFKFIHYQDCCEGVSIEDVCGDLADLVGSPLLMAEEVDNLEDFHPDDSQYESCTWTFYKFGTSKGSVTVRWLGISNGYYSESVDYSEE